MAKGQQCILLLVECTSQHFFFSLKLSNWNESIFWSKTDDNTCTKYGLQHFIPNAIESANYCTIKWWKKITYFIIQHKHFLRWNVTHVYITEELFARTMSENWCDFALGWMKICTHPAGSCKSLSNLVQNQPHFHELWVLKFHSDTTHSITCLLSINSYLSVTDSRLLNPLSTLEVLKKSVKKDSFFNIARI